MLAGAHATNSGLNLGVDSRRRPKTCSNIFKLDSSKTPARGLSHAMKQFLYISGSDAAINSTFLDSRCIEVEAATIYKDAIRTWGLSTWKSTGFPKRPKDSTCKWRSFAGERQQFATWTDGNSKPSASHFPKTQVFLNRIRLYGCEGFGHVLLDFTCFVLICALLYCWRNFQLPWFWWLRNLKRKVQNQCVQKRSWRYHGKIFYFEWSSPWYIILT